MRKRETADDAVKKQTFTEEEIAARASARAERRAIDLINVKKRMENAPRVVIDLDFFDQMTKGEKRSCMQQLMYAYAVNKAAERPLRLCYYGVPDEVSEKFDLKEWRDGNRGGQLHDFDARSYADVLFPTVPRQDIVYLTADAEEELGQGPLDKTKTYIIGGIVDHNRLKGVTAAKAKEQGIRYARLPIGNFGSKFSKVLTINHMVEVLLEFAATNDWERSLMLGIPQRKRDEKVSSAIASASLSAPARRNAVVVGASSGIGLGFVKELAKRGWNVAAMARNAHNLDEAMQSIRSMCDFGQDVSESRQAIVAIPGDAACESDVIHMRNCLFRRFGIAGVSLLVLSGGTFVWDNNSDLNSANVNVAEHLHTSNVQTKIVPLKAMERMLIQSVPSTVVIVGSQAGAPGFVEAIEAKEGKGAADNEAAYIKSMQDVRLVASGEHSDAPVVANIRRSGVRVECIEPGLVKTPLAEREFAHFGIDWSSANPDANLEKTDPGGIVHPDALARSVLARCGL